jgi:hypothetical protein
MDSELRKALATAAAVDRFFKVVYLIPHFTQDLAEASILGWYTPGLHEAARPLLTAATLPADVRERHSDPSDVLVHRMTRRIWPLITPIQLDDVNAVRHAVGSPFIVCLTTEGEVADALDAALAGAGPPVLHASNVVGAGRLPIARLNAAEIYQHVRSILDQLASDAQWKAHVRDVRRVLSAAPMWKPRTHRLPMGHHNLVTPNEFALCSFGWKLRKSKPISKRLTMGVIEPHSYVDRICQSADAVSAERERLLARFGTEFVDHRFVLAVASVHWSHYERWREVGKNADAATRQKLRHAFEAAVRMTTYVDQLDLTEDGKPPGGALYDALTVQRAKDMLSFTAGLTQLSCATLAPVLRLEPKLNQVRGDIKQLSNCVRDQASQRFHWKVSRLVRRLGDRMRSLVASEYLARVDAIEPDAHIEGMKLVTDLPLELLPTRGLPLGLRFDVSRLPPVPGNLFLQGCLTPPVFVPALDGFKEVLVLRSFREDDPLRGLFERAVAAVQEVDQRDVRCRFVDVGSPDDVVAALNGYEGAMLVFDGHGTFDPETGTGTFVVGGLPLDAWSLRRRCTFPPIVLFSACDTHPIDGSHSSIATAAFTLGARAVVGTMLPIHGAKAAMFNARLIFRLREFLPIATKVRPVLTWREVVSGMLRMTHTIEVLLQLEALRRVTVSEEQRWAVQLAANEAINSRDAMWHERFLSALARASGIAVDGLRGEIERYVGLTDAMKYVQLGCPENIVIISQLPEALLATAVG